MYWLIGALGLAFIVSPFYFNYVDNAFALWTSLVVGSVVLIMSYFEARTNGKERWEYWVVEILGIFAIFAPFILGFRNIEMAVTMSIGIGLLLALFSASKLTYVDKGY